MRLQALLDADGHTGVLKAPHTQRCTVTQEPP